MKKGKLPMRGMAALAAVAAVALGSAGAASAALTSVSGEAYGVKVSGTIVSTTPIQDVVLPPGGSSSGATVAAGGILSTGVISVSSLGDATTGPTSTATVNNLAVSANLGTFIVPLNLSLVSTVVTSTCSVDTNGVPTGRSSLANLNATFLGLPLTFTVLPSGSVAVLLNPLGGTVLGTITLNEQIVNGSSITVNAIHISLAATALAAAQDIIVSSSACAASLSAPSVAVTFREFKANASKTGVMLKWQTASESELAGFNVYRQVHGKRARVNKRIITAASNARGHRYSFVDRSLRGSRAVGARYWLQAVNMDGSRSWFGPARVHRAAH